MIITATSNSKVKTLSGYVKKKKLRDGAGIYVVEGVRMFREIPAGQLSELYVSESFYDKNKRLLGILDTKPIILTDTVYNYVSDTKTPQGILSIVKRKEYSEKEMLANNADFSLILDSLQDPGNLGTIIRSAEAAGITGIFLTKNCVDVYNPKTIRATMGSVYRIPFCYCEDMCTVMGKMKSQGINIYAADLRAGSSYDKESYKGKSAFLIGNEGNGISNVLLDKADTYIKIPMMGDVESLNAAVSATILIFEASRQRR